VSEGPSALHTSPALIAAHQCTRMEGEALMHAINSDLGGGMFATFSTHQFSTVDIVSDDLRRCCEDPTSPGGVSDTG
jgi:hypothetical protein